MSNLPPEDQSQDSEIPIVLHETAEFDVAADLGYKDAVPSGEFTRCEQLHPLTEFDCSQRIEEGGKVALRLTFHLQAGEPSPSLARDISELLFALHEYDKALGGQGLGLERTPSLHLTSPGPVARFILSRSSENLPLLEEEIAALIRSACPTEGMCTKPDDETCVSATDSSLSQEAEGPETALLRAIDHFAAEDRRRINERSEPAVSSPSTAEITDEAATGFICRPARIEDLHDIEDLQERIRSALLQCEKHDVRLAAEVIDVNRLVTTQPISRTEGHATLNLVFNVRSGRRRSNPAREKSDEA